MADTYLNIRISPAFLKGGGEMGSLVRSMNWSETSLGDPSKWPQSLRTSLSILLNSKFPMFLFWGRDLICFYNDAYRPSLGIDGKHPSILGMRAEDAWPEIWTIIKPLIDQVMSGGEATWHENKLIPIFRNGKIEDVYWTFSYSPVSDETGSISGVFVTCTETTEQVLNLGKLAESEKNFRNLVDIAPFPAALYRGKDFVIELANEEVLKLWGRDKSVIGKTLIEAMPELEGQPFFHLLQEVYHTGKTYEGKEMPAWIDKHGKIEMVYYNLIYKSIHDAEGKITGILAMGYDVSEQLSSRKKIAELEERTRLAVDAALFGTFDKNMATGESVYSKRLYEIFGFEVANARPEDFDNRVHPDDEHIVEKANADALITGATHYQFRIILPDKSIRWIDMHGKYFFDEGKKPTRYIGIASNITEQKNIIEKIEQTEKRFRNMVMQAPVGITIFRGDDFVVELANETYLQIVDKAEEEFVGKPLFVSLPEVRDVVEPLLRNVMSTGTSHYGIEFKIPLNRYGKVENTFFNFIYQALRGDDGNIDGIIVIANEVTAQVEARHALEESGRQFAHMVKQSPIAMTIWRGRDYIIETANNELLKNIWRKEAHEVMGKKALEVFPELLDQKYPQLLEKVYNTGITHRENESLAYVEGNDGMKKFYLDFEYSPLRENDGSVSGIMITVYDVTERVEARKMIFEAEERLRIAIEASEMGTFELNVQTGKVQHSNRYLEILGFPPGHNPTHADILNKVYPEDMAMRNEATQRAFETGILDYEMRVVPEKDKLRWIRIKGKVLFDEHNKPLKLSGSIIDITNEKLSRQRIEESEEKFRSLSNSVPQLVWTANASGEINYYNQAVFDYTGLTIDELIGDGWMGIVHIDDRIENMRRWMDAITSGKPYLFEHRLRRHDGEYRWQLSRALPQRDADGKIRMWVGTSTDIDEIKKHDQQKDDFIKTASHELKTPVTTIKGYVQLLINTHGNSSDKMLSSSLSTIDRQVSKLTKLITDLLDVTKIETGSLQLNKEHFSLDELVTEITGDLQMTTPKHELILDLQPNVLVYADRDRISQVLMNLLTNAIKYSPYADKVIVKTRVAASNVTLSVRDFGIGIINKDYERIFERFYRVEGKDEKTFPGFGIGLFIVKEIVGQHGGRVWVESEKDSGSVFHFTLPIL